MPFDDHGFPGLPRNERAASPRSRRLVAAWLYAIAFMILVMVALGGATRLTGSGLSIMEWAPVMGTMPPLTDSEWQRLYALYQQIPQYRLVNDGFGLDGFKQIFWLEWSHRLWGRLIGAAFLLPLVWFAATGRIAAHLGIKLGLLFVLGGLQGAVGWFMVASGFATDATAVAPVRLALHLCLALILYAAVFWTAQSLRPLGPRVVWAGWRTGLAAWIATGLAGLTILAGALVAGLHAGRTYNTFPLMDGHLVPEGYGDLAPFARDLTENIATVQFHHRLLATLTVISVLGLLAAVLPHRARIGGRMALTAAALTAQYTLGVATLLYAVPPGLAIAHQICATLLLTALLTLAHGLRPVSRPRRGPRHGQTARGTPSTRTSALPTAQKDSQA